MRYAGATVRVAEIAARQWGVVSHGQLVAAGVNRNGVARWIAAGRLHRVYPQVYAVGHDSLAIEGRLAAALFYAGKGSALSHTTAGWWWGMLGAAPTRLHVSTPGKRGSLRDVRIHSRRTTERIMHKGLPVTRPAQTLLDMASDLRFNDLRRALAEAEYRKLVTIREVAAALGRGKPGSAALGAALEDHLPQLAQTRSHMEEVFAHLCDSHLLAQPRFNARIAGYIVDAVWPAQKVVVELDSRSAHSTTRTIENDHRRDLALRAAGLTVLRYTWRQLRDEPQLVIADVRRHGIA